MKDRYRLQNHVALEELVHSFLDGELNREQQPDVFAHLADCTVCRDTVDNVMRFRQISRQKHLPVPPVVDEEFLRKLERHKVQNRRRDRIEERRPLWQTRRLVSLRTALLAGGFLLGVGLLVPAVPKQAAQSFVVRGETEQVEFRDVIYVIYPGLTVEAAKL